MSKPRSHAGTPSRNGAVLLRDFALPVGFLIVAAVLWFSPRTVEIPIGAAVAVDPAALVVEPRRRPMTDPPQIPVEGRPENCNACHQIFRSAHGGVSPLSYHTEIRLDHGLNARCINCHDAEDRERLTLRDGTTVPYAETPLLCAQCHGTTYRDWQRGIHGKTLGSWVSGSEAQRRLGCNECHDPHSPRYPAYEPLPAPRTLRMGDPAAGEHAEPAKRSPLQRWLAPALDEHGRHDAGDSP